MQVCLSILKGLGWESPGYTHIPPGCPWASPSLPSPLPIPCILKGRDGMSLGSWDGCPLHPLDLVSLCANRLVGQRLAWCGTWGRQTLPRASGVVWSWTSPLGRMMGRWRAPGMVGFPQGVGGGSSSPGMGAGDGDGEPTEASVEHLEDCARPYRVDMSSPCCPSSPLRQVVGISSPFYR